MDKSVDSDERIRHAWYYAGPADAPIVNEDNAHYACARPLEFRNGLTGEVIPVRCKTRSEKQCPGCSWLYKKDTAKILRDGLEGKGNRFFFLTLTAPSFGKTHMVPKDGRRKKPCACGRWHDPVRDADLRGVPIDCDQYRYEDQAFFNYHVGKLWDVTRSTLRKLMPNMVYAKVFEWQQRGALHLHVIIRVPAKDLTEVDGVPSDVICDVARSSTTMGGRLHWGEQCDCREIRGVGDSNKVIGYLKKAVAYVCKDVLEERPDGNCHSRNRRHAMLLDMAARAMRCDRCRERIEGVRERVEQGCGESIEDSKVALLRYVKIVSELPPCPMLAHRRWGARSGVMSVSRKTKSREGWSLNNITRRVLAEKRRAWWQEAVAGDGMKHVEAVLRSVAGSVSFVPE